MKSVPVQTRLIHCIADLLTTTALAMSAGPGRPH
jgi:hypothetical protein